MQSLLSPLFTRILDTSRRTRPTRLAESSSGFDALEDRANSPPVSIIVPRLTAHPPLRLAPNVQARLSDVRPAPSRIRPLETKRRPLVITGRIVDPFAGLKGRLDVDASGVRIPSDGRPTFALRLLHSRRPLRPGSKTEAATPRVIAAGARPDLLSSCALVLSFRAAALNHRIPPSDRQIDRSDP